MILYFNGWGSLYPANNTFSSLCSCLFIKQHHYQPNQDLVISKIFKRVTVHAQDVSNSMFLSFNGKRRRIYDLGISLVWDPEEEKSKKKRKRLRKLLCIEKGVEFIKLLLGPLWNDESLVSVGGIHDFWSSSSSSSSYEAPWALLCAEMEAWPSERKMENKKLWFFLSCWAFIFLFI